MNIATVRKFCYLNMGRLMPHFFAPDGVPLECLEKPLSLKLKIPVSNQVWHEVAIPLMYQLLTERKVK